MGNRSSRISSPSRPPPAPTMISSGDDDPKLPKDVIVEVLKRLPVKSLLRFRCVCRSWHSTIDDPRFVALHLTHSALDASNWYIVCDPLHHDFCSLFPHVSLTLPSKSRIRMPFATPHSHLYFDGSCDGLILVTDISQNGQSTYLWNLFTREYKVVPPINLDRYFSMGVKHLSLRDAHEFLGFGFDARSNDYKIVRILYCLNGYNPQVDVYSLNTGSWRSLDCEVPGFCADRYSVFFNGNLHWFTTKHVDMQQGQFESIVLFDFASEVFDKMVLSKELLYTVLVSSEVCVSVLNDLLAVCTVDGEPVGHPELHSICSVWVMREYGMPESWTKLYTFEAFGLVTGFDCFTRNGELLMKIDDEEQVSWNPITRQFVILPLSVYCNLVNIVGSLVSLLR